MPLTFPIFFLETHIWIVVTTRVRDDRSSVHKPKCGPTRMDWGVWQYSGCLPAHITVFNELATSHLPTPIQDAEMEQIVTASRSSFDLDVTLPYDCLSELPAPRFAASRMKLPCIAFPLPFSSPCRIHSGPFFVRTLSPFGWWKSNQDMTSLG